VRAKPDMTLPASDCDLLVGVGQIAAFHGISVGQCNSLIHDRIIITFRMPPRSAVLALKSENAAHWKAAAAAHHARNGDKRSNKTPSEGGASRRG
jgi:hypothetical protein